jgi:RNA polymerase sigma-70 factor (ECF subfamily)
MRTVIVQHPILEEELNVVARMARGDRRALAELYARYERPLLTYLRHLTADRELAEELLQDTLLAAWTGASSYAGQASVHAWLLGIARHRTHDTLRRRALRVVDTSVLEPLVALDPEPEDRVLLEAEYEEVTSAMNRLAPIHREVLILTFVHDLSYQDLAKVLGIPLGTVKSRLHQAKRAVRALLRPDESPR